MSTQPLSPAVRNAMISGAAVDAGDFYAKLVEQLQTHITEKMASTHPQAMPAGVREAIMIGTIGGCITNHIALMGDDARKWALKAMEEATKRIDAQSLLSGTPS